MNDHTSSTTPEDHGRDVRPAVDAAIERLIAAIPLRRPSGMLDVRIGALIERHTHPWWKRAAPIAAAAGFALAIGFVAGSWMSQGRLTGGESRTQLPALPTDGGTAIDARDARDAGLNMVLRDSSVRPAALAAPRSIDLGEEGALQAAESLWIRTDRFHDPRRGVTIERSYPETWTLVGAPAAD